MTRDDLINFDLLPGSDTAHRFDGHEHGASVSFFLSHNPPGTGPSLHRHPYDETFIIEEGTVRFTVGEREIEVTGGHIIVVPAGTPHKFVSCGPERLRQISIHPVAQMVQEELE